MSNTRINRLSGATGLLLTVLASVVTLLTTNVYSHAVFTLWLFLVLVYYGLIQKGTLLLTAYILSVLWLVMVVPRGIKFPSPMLFGMIYKLVLPAMPVLLTSNIASGKVLSALRKIPMSSNIMLVLVVLVRFAPTVSGEFKNVKEAMSVRGFIGNKSFLHPLKTLEYVVVPMIFRALKVADELAAASIVRGIENPVSKKSYYDVKFSLDDFIVLGFSCVIGIAAIWFKGSV